MAFATYGELRAQLALEGIPWTVNPNLPDSSAITRPSLGADLTHYPRAAGFPTVDVLSLVRAIPTANCLLRAYLVKAGVLDGSAPFSDGTSGSTDITGSGDADGATGKAGGGSHAAVDWRNRWGWSFVTGIRDQSTCEHCWIYGATALIESMVRIEHCVWCDRSEGDYIEANQVSCGTTGDPTALLQWAQTNGVADLGCVPWVDCDPGDRSGYYWDPAPGTVGLVLPPIYTPPANRVGRTVRIPAFTSLGDVSSQKRWIDYVGPLVSAIDVYSDFVCWSGDVPYSVSSTATLEGSHVILAVGYDDSAECWIIKNSWGTTWGNGGFGLIGYGQSGIDDYVKAGFRHSNPDPWTKHRSHSGGMIESGDGALHCNFELVVRSSGNSFTHLWRDNSVRSLAWNVAEVLANDVAGALTLTGTTNNRNFETVYRTLSSQLHHYYFDQASQAWTDGGIFGPTNAVGEVGFCESDYGIGSLEVVVAGSDGTLQHWCRSGSSWNLDATFGSGVLTAAPSLLESTYDNLELVVVLANGEMQPWSRADGVWSSGESFGTGVRSPPCMIQGQGGMASDSDAGNFELCVSIADGTVQHWWRNNHDTNLTWQMGDTFGESVKQVIALIEGSFGFNLEAVVQLNDGMLQHYWHDDGGWRKGAAIGTTL